MLRDAVDAIHRAADDPRVAGLIARVQLSTAAAGPVSDVTAAAPPTANRGHEYTSVQLARFTAKHKPVRSVGRVWIERVYNRSARAG